MNTLGQHPETNSFPVCFSTGLSFYSADAHDTYKKEEIEEEEEVLGDFQAARPHLLSLTRPKGKANRQPVILLTGHPGDFRATPLPCAELWII